MRLLLLSGILVFSLATQFAHATVTITSIAGASAVGSLTSLPIMIYAGASGTAGLSTCPTAGTSCSTCCNTCGNGTLQACNENAISGSTQLTINFTSTASGTVQFYDTATSTPIAFTSGTLNYTANTGGSVSIPWSTLCGVTASAICGTIDGAQSVTKTISFGISNGTTTGLLDSTQVSITYANMDNYSGSYPAGSSIASSSDGVSDFTLFPGDSKTYITDMEPDNLSGTFNVTGVVGYYALIADQSDQSTACAPVPSADMVNVTNSSDNSLVGLDPTTKEIIDNRISGLENDSIYIFRFAIQDIAGNIGFFTDDNTGNGGILTCDWSKHAVKPQLVFGLLDKNQNCFISTAAYGSPLNAKVKTFKLFRDKILKQYSWGRQFVDYYYAHSPKWAMKIRANDKARAVTRVFLWPLWAMSVIVLKIGLGAFLAILASLALIFFLVKKKYFRFTYFMIFAFLALTSLKGQAQDDSNFFDLKDDTKAAPTAPVQETAPQEPPYTGTENDEFKEVITSASKDAAENPKRAQDKDDVNPKRAYQENFSKGRTYEENYNKGTGEENPNKWKPYSRVPEEGRLDDLSNQEGLFKITKKGEYLYDVPASPQHHAASFRVGVAQFPSLQNSNGITFQQIYGDSRKPMVMADYEWQIFNSFGKLGIKFGSGLLVASGNGQFENEVTKPDGSTTTQAQEKYNFFLFPNSLSAIYRLDIFKNQWLVPFAEGGFDYFTFFELRDDGKGFKYGGSPLAHFAVGGSFLLDVFDRASMVQVDHEYGVSHVWLTAEFRRLQNLGSALDFSDNVIDAGVTFEF